MMDLTWTDEQAAFRADARAWLEENHQKWRDLYDGDIKSGDSPEGYAQGIVWEHMLFEGGWAVVSWPKEYGGRDADQWEWLIFEEEYYRVGAPQRATQNGIFLLAPSVFEHGTQAQRDYILPRMAAAEDMWCQGWSEPNAGSDLASLRSRATKVDGGWVLNGQKIWTTRGAYCTHLFGLFRSDPESERHRGLTYLLMPLDLEGITVRGFEKLGGDLGFAEVFFEDAFLPDDVPYESPVLGGVGNGWKVTMSTLGNERGLTTRPPERFLVSARRLLELFRECGSPPHLRDRVLEVWTRAEAYEVQTWQYVTDLLDGRSVGSLASLVKLWWSELDIELNQLALDLLGDQAEVTGPWAKSWIFSIAGPIYAGSNEIQRNIAAERILGLPR
jgi:alkylation response protein AidB-like acyl-CoA dehydrogenase